MELLRPLARPLSDWLWLSTLRRHRTRMGVADGPKYTNYLRRCQAAFAASAPTDPTLQELAEEFERDGLASFGTPETAALARAMRKKVEGEEAAGEPIWDGQGVYQGELYRRFPEIETLFRGAVGDFLRAAYGAHFKIHYGVLYKSERRRDVPDGSELWHSDGGPGTCINLMFCLSEVDAGNGAMECLPWPAALDIFARERKTMRARTANARLGKLEERALRAAYYGEEIERRYRDRIAQPVGGPGLVFAFRNNTLHKGGFPQPGRTRLVCVFHLYPSDRPTPYELYREKGIAKRSPYPVDPAD